jgi:hypothetical protein
MSYKTQTIIEGGKEYEVVIYKFGDIAWLLNNELNREIGPAYIGMLYKAWHKNDLWHRLDGPASIYSNGTKEWYINGKEIKEQTHTKVRTMLSLGLDRI